MGHRKKTGITIFLSIFVCLIGLAGSMAGSLRYGLRDKAVDTLTREWDLSQMQITKIAAFMSMAQFFVVMVDTPGIQEAGAIKLLDASYTRDYIAAKMRDYRDDLLTGNGKGRFDFEEIRQLEEAHREEVCRDLQYNITAEDMTKYETIWDNLGLADRTALEYYRIDRPGLFSAVGMILSGWFLFLSVLLVAGTGVGLWFLNGHSFAGHGIYGGALLAVGILDCAAAVSCGWAAEAVNRFVDMRSNLMALFFSPVGNMLLGLGVISALLGVLAIALSALEKRR